MPNFIFAIVGIVTKILHKYYQIAKKFFFSFVINIRVRKNKMNVSMRTMIPAAIMAVSAITMASCGSKSNNNAKETINKVQLAPYDSTKANLPVIEGDRITYRNEDGDIVTVKSDDDADGQITQSLYKAVRKFSTPEKPNITEPTKFYAEVSKNIPKNYQSGVYNSSTHNSYHALVQGFLNKLFDIYAEDDSEAGTTITVKEYTEMMDAWSSTGIRE